MGEIETLRAISLLEHSGAFLWVMHLCIFAKTSLGVKKKARKKKQAFALVVPTTCSKERSR